MPRLPKLPVGSQLRQYARIRRVRSLSKSALIQTLRRQLAVDYNCSPAAFSGDSHLIFLPSSSPRRRHIGDTAFFSMVTLGENAVICADERIFPFMQRHAAGKSGAELFEHYNLTAIDAELCKFGQTLDAIQLLNLPDMRLLPRRRLPAAEGYEIVWYRSQTEVARLRESGKFRNALTDGTDPARPDMLAVAAVEGGIIRGLSGVSADSSLFWQIGVDIDDSARGKGLGTLLVGLLKNEVIRRGKIPYYGSNVCNIASRNIAFNTGFFPAWTEVRSVTANV